MEIEDVQMQIQSYLCQLGVKDLVEIAKTLGCSDGDTKEKNRKGLVRLIEEKLEGTLKGTKADKMEQLEEFLYLKVTNNGAYACLPSAGSKWRECEAWNFSTTAKRG